MQVNVGLIGIGTIGAGVVKIVRSGLTKKRAGLDINLKVCDLDEAAARKLGIKEVCKDYNEILDDDSIDIVVELIGGYNPAKDIIMKALKKKKHVVTANKAVIAKYGNEIFEAARKNRAGLGFEAAVGGCIPIVKTITESYLSDNIREIYGILNGTTNYILTKMEEGMPYEEALKKAQKLGFAEADPSFDVEGKDAAQKLVILSSLAFDARLEDDILSWGITKISKNDLSYARELNYTIKLLAIAKNINKEIELRVHPTMIPADHELATVKNELNAVYVIGENTGKTMLYGKGAGQLPTATVVVGDIIDIAKGKRMDHSFRHARTKDIKKIISRYYLRAQVVDRPGVLAKISKILGDNDISIAGVQQKEANKKIVPLIMTTHDAMEENMIKAVKEINRQDFVKEKTVVIRIEDIK